MLHSQALYFCLLINNNNNSIIIAGITVIAFGVLVLSVDVRSTFVCMAWLYITYSNDKRQIHDVRRLQRNSIEMNRNTKRRFVQCFHFFLFLSLYFLLFLALLSTHKHFSSHNTTLCEHFQYILFTSFSM